MYIRFDNDFDKNVDTLSSLLISNESSRRFSFKRNACVHGMKMFGEKIEEKLVKSLCESLNVCVCVWVECAKIASKMDIATTKSPVQSSVHEQTTHHIVVFVEVYIEPNIHQNSCPV